VELPLLLPVQRRGKESQGPFCMQIEDFSPSFPLERAKSKGGGVTTVRFPREGEEKEKRRREKRTQPTLPQKQRRGSFPPL